MTFSVHGCSGSPSAVIIVLIGHPFHPNAVLTAVTPAALDAAVRTRAVPLPSMVTVAFKATPSLPVIENQAHWATGTLKGGSVLQRSSAVTSLLGS